MKRWLTWLLLFATVLVAGGVALVLLRADSAGLPAPDPATSILLPDGSRRPLSEVLGLVRDGQPLPDPRPLLSTPTQGTAGAPAPEQLAAARAEFLRREGPIFQLAEEARRAGRLDEAEALYLSIPKGDPRWARAQRRLGWDVLASGRRQPERGVPYAHAALAAEPFDGNAWEDLVRVYAATLGLDSSGWD